MILRICALFCLASTLATSTLKRGGSVVDGLNVRLQLIKFSGSSDVLGRFKQHTSRSFN